MRRILFIGHSAHRSGAPLLLLDFLKWLRARQDLQFDVDLVRGGSLLADYAAVADTRVLRQSASRSFASRVVRRLKGDRRVEMDEDRIVTARARAYDLVYVNTIVPVREMLAVHASGVPIICHAHEMDSAADQWLDRRGLAPIVPIVTQFIAASRGVRDYLVERNAVSASKVTTVHSFTTADREVADQSANRLKWRKTLGLRPDEFLVGSCGTLDWRKGADLFIQIARRVAVRSSAPRFRFLWVGADRSSLDYRRFAHELRVCGLESTMVVLESVPNAREIFPAMDTFALTSREDPFPLVMLEAALVGLPIVCFDSSGGGPEFAGDDAGVIVPYLDVDAFADALLRLRKDADAGRALGAAARQKVLRDYTVESQAPKLCTVIERVVGQARGTVASDPTLRRDNSREARSTHQ
jgi:glycosyltransferase involved in cell wall biosynthesis